MVSNLMAVGISSTVTAVPQDKWVPTLLQAQFEAALHEIDFADPAAVLAAFQTARGVLKDGRISGLNYGGYASPEFDELAAAAQRARDATARRDLLYQLQAVLAADLPQIPLYSPRLLSLFREERFGGWTAQPGIGLLHRRTVLGLRPVAGD
jgi:ABC-type oligopeptide transport system substrate-binding subunit